MKQILQNLKTGKTELVDVPSPSTRDGHILIRSRASLISAGTERMLVEFGKAGWINKARQQPDKVKQVLDKVRADGIIPTFNAVRSKLDQPIPLGYCNVGQVLEVRSWRTEVGGEEDQKTSDHRFSPSHLPTFSPSTFRAGDRVVSNGPHAEVVCVPQNLSARVPDGVSDEEAAFTIVGAIALQGIRLSQPTLGEAFAVIGLGLIGQLTVQVLTAHGCRVLGIDPDARKCSLARGFGAEAVDLSKSEDALEAARSFSAGRGLDAVLITAATKSSDPVHHAAHMCRKRGRIVLVGVTGLDLNRSDFYEKELTFQVSCSYGPGRYDPEYEEKGHDYPVGYVRWTEQRNFEAVLDLMARGKINVKPLISHRFPLEQAERAYELISENKEPYLGIILEYQRSEVRGQRSETDPHISLPDSRTVILQSRSQAPNLKPQTPVIGMIGAGSFSGQVLLPAIQKTGVRLKTIASAKGVTATHLGKKFGFETSTTDAESIFADPEINTAFITTRHDSHARFVLGALKAGKHVFVEKPLCLTLEELYQIQEAEKIRRSEDGQNRDKTSPSPLVMVGFNRRFAPHVVKMKELLNSTKEPKSMIMTVNAGFIAPEHWTQDPETGGGRIIGEACHFIDLLRFLAGREIADSRIVRPSKGPRDTATITLAFKDGSIGTLHYFSNGSKKFPKERLEVFCGQRILHLDNFRTMRGYGWKGLDKMRLWGQDKGHDAEVKAFVHAVQEGKPAPIPFEEIMEVMRVTIELSGRE